MRKMIAVVCVVVLVSGVGLCQAVKDGPTMSVFGGYQFMSFDAQGSRINITSGWDADFAWRPVKTISAVADVSGSYKSLGSFDGVTPDLHVHNFLAGPRFSPSRGNVIPFAEFLVGVAHTTVSASGESGIGSYGFGMAAGGGLDVGRTRHFAVRLVKFDYVLDKVDFGSSVLGIQQWQNLNHFRLSAGVVYNF
jgi:hypothetical protein